MFGGQLRFDQPHDELLYCQSYLSLRIRQQDPVVHKFLRQQAMAQLEMLHSQSGGFLARIEKLIKGRMGSGGVTLKDLAPELGMSPRTLQHRLDRYGVNFRNLVDGLRHSQAKQHLRLTDLSLAEIADMLGFSNQTSFQRAFKRWTGQTPGEFRRERRAQG